MNDSILIALIKKRDELEKRVATFERKIIALSDDLSSMRSVLAFHRQGIPNADILPHMDLNRLFHRRELMNMCVAALKRSGEGMDSRELAEEVIQVKGLDIDDPVLHERMTAKVAYVMRKAWARQLVTRGGLRNGIQVWWLKVI